LGFLGFTPVRGQVWGGAFLSLWLEKDHGKVNELGHGLDPGKQENIFGFLGTKKEASVGFRSLSEAIEWDKNSLYELIPLTEHDELIGLEATYAVVFRFIDVPRDAIILVIRNSKTTGPTIIRLFSLVA
jgi:hypothetical protein